MLIIKDKIQQLMKGYPTVSDKYNVSGAVLAGTEPAAFGSVVKNSATKGYFEAITANNKITAVTDISGIVLATNVKLAQEWPGSTVQVNPGEAFNLLINGFIAVELVSTAVSSDIVANAPVYITQNGEFTTKSDSAKLGETAIPNTVFTGIYENNDGKVYAEIYVK